MLNATVDSREKSVASQLPYSQQISPTTVITEAGDYTSTIQAHGISFDTMIVADLDGFNHAWFNAINSCLATPSHAVWTHIVRTKQNNVLMKDEYDNDFSADFVRQYNESLKGTDFFSNRLYISPVLRLAGNTSDRIGMRLSSKSSKEYKEHQHRAKGLHERMVKTVFSQLRRYHPQQLDTYTNSSGFQSKISEFYAHLLNHQQYSIPLQRANLSRTLQRATLDFGEETVRIANPASTSFAAILSMVSPYTTEQLNCKALETLLTAPFEFILSQSFVTMAQDNAERMLKQQMNRIKSTAANELQIVDIQNALDNLQAGKFKMLGHEFLLVVYGDTMEDLNSNVNEAVQLLTKKTIQVSRETGGSLISAYFSMFPGAFQHGRIRSQPISSANMAKLFPLHNYPSGNRRGSQWGNPLMVMSTESKNPYYLNLHVSRDRLAEQGINIEYDDETDETEKNKAHRKEIGNYIVIGESGSGKTTLKAAMRACLRRTAKGNKPVKIFTLDKDNSEEIVMRAMGAQYFTLQPGQPIGINPFQWGNDERTMQTVFEIAKWAAEYDSNFKLSSNDYRLLKRAITDVFEFEVKTRRFGLLIQTLPSHEAASLRNSLARWSYDKSDAKAAPYAWVLDSPTDGLSLEGATAFGFDMTAVFDLPYAKTPVMQLITEKIARSAVGTPHIIDIAEAWKALGDPLFANYMEDKSRTIRKQDGVIGLDTQNASDVVDSDLGLQFLDQFPTYFLLPNAKAKPEVYIKGLGLTPRELELVRNARPDLGEVLIKKGSESIVARMNLTGMNDMQAVLSSTPDNVDLVRSLVREMGPDPKIWLPEFYKRRN